MSLENGEHAGTFSQPLHGFDLPPEASIANRACAVIAQNLGPAPHAGLDFERAEIGLLGEIVANNLAQFFGRNPGPGRNCLNRPLMAARACRGKRLPTPLV